MNHAIVHLKYIFIIEECDKLPNRDEQITEVISADEEATFTQLNNTIPASKVSKLYPVIFCLQPHTLLYIELKNPI